MDVLKYGGGAGMGSYVLVLKNGVMMPFSWREVNDAFNTAQELYLSIVVNNDEISLIELEGKKTSNGLELVGRDTKNSKTYYINQKDYDSVEKTQKVIEAEGSGIVNEYKTLEYKTPYLYAVAYDTIDYNYGKADLLNEASFLEGACSSVRKGNFYGRNFDLNYNHQAVFVVSTPASAGRNKVLGVAGGSGLKELTETFVDERKYSEKYKALPFYLMDGINDKGVFCNINLVHGDTNVTTVTVPTIEEKDRISAIMLVRYILDKYDTALEAILDLEQHVAIYMPQYLLDNNQQIHLMIGDKTTGKTYVVEFINNLLYYNEINYMTNFYVEGVNFNNDGTVYTPADLDDHNPVTDNNIQLHGNGLERWNIIVNAYDSLSNKEDMQDLMTSLYYTNTYTKESNIWYSEFAEKYSDQRDVTLNTPIELYTDIITIIKEYYENRSRDTGLTWQTVHSCVYDLEHLRLYIISQEDGNEFCFDLNDHCEKLPDLPEYEEGVSYSLELQNDEAGSWKMVWVKKSV